ncbi:tetratricopeptide repeat protein [Candidatus Peregrinibacteria bacterium]|nr:tetratricopeptide repeat protein [Candidatus Peregrinibacteria bacterium]
MDSQTYELIVQADEKKLKGEHMDAIKICEKILNEDLRCIEAYEEIGDNYLSLKEFEKAEKALLKAIQLKGHSANANYLLGFVYSSLAQWKKSIKHLELADEIQKNHPEILRCLGWSLFHGGQRKKGVIILERSLNLAPADCLILCDLGVCYLNERNFERAIHLFARALDIEPSNEKAKECLDTARFFEREYKKPKERINFLVTPLINALNLLYFV